MAGNLTRKPSVTPNISNFDDARMFRYALGGYNGVTEKYKNECSYTVDGSTFKINSGEIVIDGWQYGIDASGESITVDNIAGTQYYSVYLEIDLSIIDDQKGTIESTYDTASYPTITKGDDLTELQTGIARLELYRFEASGGVISNVVQRFSLIEVGNVLHAENADLATNATNAANDSDGNPINTTYTKDSDFNNSSQTAFGDYIVSKKELLWSGSKAFSVDPSAPADINLSSNLSAEDIIEIHCNEIIGGNRYYYIFNGKMSEYGISLLFNGNAVIGSTGIYTLFAASVADDYDMLRISSLGKITDFDGAALLKPGNVTAIYKIIE